MSQWTETKVDQLIDEISALGMTIDPAGRPLLAEQIDQRVATLARHLRVSETDARRHFADDAVRELARSLVAPFADEQPGLDIAGAEPDAVLPRALASRVVIALAEALRIHLANAVHPAVALQTAWQCADLFALHGARLYAAANDTTVPVTSAWLTRTARQLEHAADTLDAGGTLADSSGQVDPTELATRFRDDAHLLRTRTTGPE